MDLYDFLVIEMLTLQICILHSVGYIKLFDRAVTTEDVTQAIFDTQTLNMLVFENCLSQSACSLLRSEPVKEHHCFG